MIVYLAGGEHYWRLMLECGVRNQIYSFYRLRTMTGKAFMEMVANLQAEKYSREDAGEPQLRLLLDSGASAYINYKGKKPSPDLYFRDYRECLARTRDLWSHVTEMDLDSLVGLKQVEEWREELMQLHPQVLPVWNAERGLSAWTAYCENPSLPYLAFGAGLDVGLKDRLCHYARVAGKQVHACAETKLQTDMKYLQADSFGSALWLSAQKFDSLYVFHGNQLRLLDKNHKQDRKLFKAYFAASGIDFAQVMADDPQTIAKCSLIAWRNMADRLEAQGVRNVGIERSGRTGSIEQEQTIREVCKAGVAGKQSVDESSNVLRDTRSGGFAANECADRYGDPQSSGPDRVHGDTTTAESRLDNVQAEYLYEQRTGADSSNRDRQRRSLQQQEPSRSSVLGAGPGVTDVNISFDRENCNENRSGGRSVRLILDRKLGRLVPTAINVEDKQSGSHTAAPRVEEKAWNEHVATCQNFHQCANYTADPSCAIGTILLKAMQVTPASGDWIKRSNTAFDNKHIKELQAASLKETSVSGNVTVICYYCQHESPSMVEATKHVNEKHSKEEAEAKQHSKPFDDSETQTTLVSIPCMDDQDIVSYPKEIEDDLATLSANMPKTVCDNCAISGECKEYQAGAVCFFDDDFDKLPVRNLNANLAEREMLLKFDRVRLMRSIMAERVSAGGVLDPRVSQAMDDYIRRKNDFVTLANKRGTSPVTASLKARGKPGVFSQLFGAAMPTGKRSEGDTEIPLNEPIQPAQDAAGEVEITMTVTKDVPNKKE